MRTITYTCDRCGKKLTSSSATKLNTTIFRGLDSSEKKNYDFCSKCFLKMKKAWERALKDMGNATEEPDPVPKTKPVIDELPVTQPPILDDTVRIPTVPPAEPKEWKPKAKPVIEHTVTPVKEEPVAPAKRRGRPKKPVDTDQWKTRTEIVQGVIKPWEKELILKFYVEDGLTTDEIAEKLHRLPKGIKRTISSAEKSGELDKLKAKAKEHMEGSGEDIRNVDIFGRCQRSTYIGPSDIQEIDGVRYDIGAIMAFHNAGWGASKIAEENIKWDEDIIRVIIESRTGKQG